MNDFYTDENFQAYANGSYYGSYRTRTFAQIFSSYEIFEAEYNACKLKINDFNENFSLANLYYMLYAHYGNSHISYSDENQFKYYLYSIIFQYAPSVIKEKYIQDKLRAMTDDELKLGGKAIYNHSYNPSTDPSTSTLEELTTINDQNTTNYKKTQMEGYSILMSLLKRDVIDDFIHKFKRLFIKVAAPDYPLLYSTEV